MVLADPGLPAPSWLQDLGSSAGDPDPDPAGPGDGLGLEALVPSPCAAAPSNRPCYGRQCGPHRHYHQVSLPPRPLVDAGAGHGVCHHHRQASLWRALVIQNLFNLAMVAYVLLLVSFPVQMTSRLPLQHRRLRHPGRRAAS